MQYVSHTQITESVSMERYAGILLKVLTMKEAFNANHH